MKLLIWTVAFGLSLSAAIPATAMTDAECASAWTRTDVNKDGKVTEAEAARYYASMRIANKPMADGAMTKDMFIESCKSGIYTPPKTDEGAPLKGANSFTEGQAKDRVIARGFSDVSGMKQNDDGIWLGSAMQNGKKVQVAVDYKGNVVAN